MVTAHSEAAFSHEIPFPFPSPCYLVRHLPVDGGTHRVDQSGPMASSAYAQSQGSADE